jgi:SAP domain-containing ribonucleoprotein
MSDYAKKKNDELMALCKERGLAHTGKKADLVKRLEEHDSQPSTTTATAAAPEDEIDWDEDNIADVTAKAAMAADGSIGTASELQGVPNQPVTLELAPTSDLTTQPPVVAVPGEKKPEVDFSTGLAERTLDEEIEKRKARARKFGLPEDTEEIKALERAKRFGTAATELPGLGLLNGALPEKRERKPRGGEAAPGGDGGIRKKGRERERERGAKGKVRGEKPKAAGGAAPAASGEGGQYPGWMTQKDREAADRRKAKFSTAS